MQDLITLADLNTAINHEPRVLDMLVAERLGFKRPRNIRKLVERNKTELESYGQLASKTVAPLHGGAPTEEYWLNEAQALLICTFSRTPKAAAVRKALIEVYQAYRSGTLAPQQLPAPGTVQVRSYTRRKAISPAVKRYTEILEVALDGYAKGATFFNNELKQLGHMKNFRQAIMEVLTMAADMERAGATREDALTCAKYGGLHIGIGTTTNKYGDGGELWFPEFEAQMNPAKDLIAKGLMAPRT